LKNLSKIFLKKINLVQRHHHRDGDPLKDTPEQVLLLASSETSGIEHQAYAIHILQRAADFIHHVLS
jgi:hypothetical protein